MVDMIGFCPFVLVGIFTAAFSPQTDPRWRFEGASVLRNAPQCKSNGRMESSTRFCVHQLCYPQES